MFNVREEENDVYTFKEAFIPQLTLTNSEKLFWFLLCSAVEFPADGDVFKPPSPATDPSIGGRQWSSLKSSASPAAAERGDSRERAKSLPAHGAICKYYIHYKLQRDSNKQQEMQEKHAETEKLFT